MSPMVAVGWVAATRSMLARHARATMSCRSAGRSAAVCRASDGTSTSAPTACDARAVRRISARAFSGGGSSRSDSLNSARSARGQCAASSHVATTITRSSWVMSIQLLTILVTPPSSEPVAPLRIRASISRSSNIHGAHVRARSARPVRTPSVGESESFASREHAISNTWTPVRWATQ